MTDYSIHLPPGPLYDPNSKIVKFRFEEDYNIISQNQLGTGKLFEDNNYFFYLGNDIEWKRPNEICSHPFFIKGKPDRTDALQGKLGNCWFVSAVEAITLNDDLIKHVVPPDQSFDHNYAGVFHFRIWQLGTWYDVVVDDRLPVFKDDKELCYLTSRSRDIFWAALLEKAYAKVNNASTVSLIGTTSDDLELGFTMTGLQDLSGGIVEFVSLRFPTYPPSSTTVKSLVNKVFMKKALMVCECLLEEQGLVNAHTYTVTNIFQFSDDDPNYRDVLLIKLMNPWGFKEWKGAWSDDDTEKWKLVDPNTKRLINLVSKNDGEFWMEEGEFSDLLDNVHICHLGPGQYISSHFYLDFDNWRTTTFYGEWAKTTAGGAAISTRHENPQYRIHLDLPENDPDNDGFCTVIIDLTRKINYTERQIAYNGIVVFIYSLKDLTNPPIPLDNQFFVVYNPIVHPDFSTSNGRSYVLSLHLEPGKYCIVPCTERSHQESPFLLRVFSESRVQLWEYDTTIAKSLRTEEQNVNETNEELQRLFGDIAQGKNEIDWIGLKEILDTAMNQKKSFFGMIASFFEFVKDVFEKYLPFQSPSDCETGDVVFTKDECRSMIAMLDDDRSGKLSFSEFCTLWNKICFWTKAYEQHKAEMTGHVTIDKLKNALSSIGYNITNRILNSLSYLYVTKQGNIYLKDFILCGITLETVLTLYQKKNDKDVNRIALSLEEWVKNTLVL